MTSSEIAAMIADGNMADARAALIVGQTQQSAAVLTVDVLDDLMRDHFGEDFLRARDIVRQCLKRG